MQPERERARLTHAWLAKADHDLIVARRACDAPPVFDVAVYHCQQAMEKALKAFLTWHGRPFRRTHNLPDLVRRCERLDPEFSALASAAELLAPYATEFRYPGDLDTPTEDEAAEALEVARGAMRFVTERLPVSGTPSSA